MKCPWEAKWTPLPRHHRWKFRLLGRQTNLLRGYTVLKTGQEIWEFQCLFKVNYIYLILYFSKLWKYYALPFFFSFFFFSSFVPNPLTPLQDTTCELQNETTANNPAAIPQRSVNLYYMVKLQIRSGKKFSKHTIRKLYEILCPL